MNGVLYNECLYGCALEPDLQILPGGDLAEIGEKVHGHSSQGQNQVKALMLHVTIRTINKPILPVTRGGHWFNLVLKSFSMRLFYSSC